MPAARNVPHHTIAFAQRIAVIAFVLLATGCSSAMQWDTVTVTIKGKPFILAIADTEKKHEVGLMNRTSMPSDCGMLFVFDIADTYSFWMKDTLIPLDIIFLDSSGRVIDIHKRQALDESGMGPDSPALFVIELNFGMSETIGLKRGDLIPIPDKYLKTMSASSEKNN